MNTHYFILFVWYKINAVEFTRTIIFVDDSTRYAYMMNICNEYKNNVKVQTDYQANGLPFEKGAMLFLETSLQDNHYQPDSTVSIEKTDSYIMLTM